MMDIEACDPRVLQKLKEQTIRNMWSTLCGLIEPQRYFIILRTQGVFTQDDEEEISSQITTKQKATTFLDKLLKRSNGYDILVNVLRQEKVQAFIVDDMDKTLKQLVKKHGSEYSGQVNVDDSICEDVSGLPGPGQPYGPSIP